MKQTLVNVNDLFEELGHGSGLKPEKILELIKQYGIEIIAEMPIGRGVIRMMSKDQAAEIRQKHKSAPAPRTSGSEDPQLHIFRLEERIKELTAEVKGMCQTFELFQRASNIQADRLGKVLEQLGSTP